MKKKHLKELRRITESIPKELTDNVVKIVDVAPSVKEVLTRALKEPSVSAKKKRRIKNLLESGKLDKKMYETNREIEAKINEYLDREIDKAIKLGRLPKEDKAFTKKMKQYAKERQDQSDNREHTGENPGVTDNA